MTTFDFRGKKITVMRIGLLGRGVGDTAFLAEMGADIHVVDDAPVEVMQPSVDALKHYPNIRFTFGPYKAKDFVDADYVLYGAGSPKNLPVFEVAREHGVPLMQSAAWFAKLSGMPIIGVTGTRGKSSVTHMIHHVLTQTLDRPILLGGNVRGVSNLQLLKEVQDNALCVMELDSWQLQGFGQMQISPHIAIFTNLLPDHMNYYNNDMYSYFDDKANIFKHQTNADYLIVTDQSAGVLETYNVTPPSGHIMHVSASDIPVDTPLLIPGIHNKENAACAAAALRAVGVNEEAIISGLSSFTGVPGRLEYLGEKNGVTVYNDNNATSPDATIVGLRAVATKKNVILIMGGANKGLDMSELIKQLPTYCKSVILISGTGTTIIRSDIQKHFDGEISEYEKLEDCVTHAAHSVQDGDVILFSPALASFSTYFQNEYERNDAFVQLAQKHLL